MRAAEGGCEILSLRAQWTFAGRSLGLQGAVEGALSGTSLRTSDRAHAHAHVPASHKPWQRLVRGVRRRLSTRSPRLLSGDPSAVCARRRSETCPGDVPDRLRVRCGEAMRRWPAAGADRRASAPTGWDQIISTMPLVCVLTHHDVLRVCVCVVVLCSCLLFSLPSAEFTRFLFFIKYIKRPELLLFKSTGKHFNVEK